MNLPQKPLPRIAFPALLLLALPLFAQQHQVATAPQQKPVDVTTLARQLESALPSQSAASSTQQLDNELNALTAAWHETADGEYFRALQHAVDRGIQQGPAHIPARAALVCFRVLATPRYKAAAEAAYKQPAQSGDEVFRAYYAQTFALSSDLHDAVQRLLAEPASPQHLADLVDTLEILPPDSPERKPLLDQLDAQAAGSRTPSGRDNDLKAYALAKGARLGFLPARFETQARHSPDSNTSSPGSDLWSTLLAATEAAQHNGALAGRGKTVVVDAWFNSQTRPSPSGAPELFHYKWNDDQNSGFRFFGLAFQRFGAQLAMLPEAPTVSNLAGAKVYVIPSPDIPAKNPNPHYMDPASVKAIEQWVRAGGVLLLMENDKASSEFEHFNTLSERFGIHFNPMLRNTVEGNHYEQGRLNIPAGTGGIFPLPLAVYMKEICTITVSGPARSIFTDKGDTLMAVSRVGKGTVYAVVDPWLYNEYTDGRKLSPEYQDFAAAIDLARWSLAQAK